MEQILAFISENLSVILAGTGTVSMVGYGIYFLKKTILPKALTMVATIVSNMFGVPYDGVHDLVNRLPIADKLDELAKKGDIELQSRLLALAKDLSSPLYNEDEKLAIRMVYNELYEKAKPAMTLAFTQLLDVYQNHNK
jgi:hypothetical protein